MISRVLLFFSVITLFCFNCILFKFVYNSQPKPYIDEIFHVPQTVEYCKGEFGKWDPKITTLPGLYVVSIGILIPLSTFTNINLCTLFGLRSINLVISLVNFYLLYKITKVLHPNLTAEWKVLMTALNISILPPLHFFTFLYYTDTVSTCFVLTSYLLHLQRKHWLAASAGFAAVATRQTNILWVAFFASETIVEFLKEEAIWRRKKKISPAVESSFKYLQILNFVVADTLKQDSYRIGHFIGRLLASVIGYFFVGLSFIVFVLYNGSIVVGDKSAHSATIHFPQILYFSLFASVFSGPHFVTKLKQFFKTLFVYRIHCLIALILCILAIHFNSMAHPYLLADNRHYTFYIWKRLLSKEKLRDLLIPWYLFGLYCIHDTIHHKSIIFQLAFWTFASLNLIPQKLFELRYFIIPYLMMRLQMKPGSSWQLLLEGIFAMLINLLTIYLFVSRTFYWSDSLDPQRFIW